MSTFLNEVLPHAKEIAVEIFGEPNPRSTATELRFGRKSGSLILDIKKGTFKDFGGDGGGGLLDLVRYGLDCEKETALEWLRAKGFLSGGRGGNIGRFKKSGAIVAAVKTKPAPSMPAQEKTQIDPSAATAELMKRAISRPHQYADAKRLGELPTVTAADLAAVGYRYLQSSGGRLDLSKPLILTPAWRFGQNGNPEPSTSELIDFSGNKAVLPGKGYRAGAWCPAGQHALCAASMPVPGENMPIVICEGRATAEALNKSLNTDEFQDYLVIAAFSATNILPVAQSFKIQYGVGQKIIIAADLGAEAKPHHLAIEAAQAVGGVLVYPQTRQPGADFSDIYIDAGAAGVMSAVVNTAVAFPSPAQTDAGAAENDFNKIARGF